MKKILTLVVLLAMTAVSVQAQIDFGVKGGFNLTNMSVSKDVLAPSNQVGFFIGPTAKMTIPIVGLGVDAAALFDQRSVEVEGMDEKVKKSSLQVPVNLRYTIGLSSLASIYFFAGPQFGFSLGTKDFENKGVEWTNSGADLSGNIGAGVMVLKHVQASLNYNFALGKTGEFEVLNEAGEWLGKNGKKTSGRMNAWQLSVAYFF